MTYPELVAILEKNLEGVSESDLRQKLEDTIDRLRLQQSYNGGKRKPKRKPKAKPRRSVLDRAVERIDGRYD